MLYASVGTDAWPSPLALKQVSIERPAYRKGVSAWWEEVIRRTAIGAGADAQAVSQSLDEIVPRLIHRFSSKEGYKLFDDTVETCAYNFASCLR